MQALCIYIIYIECATDILPRNLKYLKYLLSFIPSLLDILGNYCRHGREEEPCGDLQVLGAGRGQLRGLRAGARDVRRGR